MTSRCVSSGYWVTRFVTEEEGETQMNLVKAGKKAHTGRGREAGNTEREQKEEQRGQRGRNGVLLSQRRIKVAFCIASLLTPARLP